ncbi:MAG: SMC-Scp complex subunit ScpB [Candidatus Omnitrophota bacterium]|jgi:segregation and condensation protein B|nr:MAG: SMC-Scp complex subunit ScpB [Candidatus Omnitrophota bacterium]
MAEDGIRSAIEALLFVSEKPLTIEQIKKTLGVDADLARQSIDSLRAEYELSKRGIRVYEVAGGFRMISAPDFSVFLKKLHKGAQSDKLSKPALETLAIIAYKQPVTRLEIESLRQVNIDGVISTLLERSLIRITGRRKAPGNPYCFGTTREFLEHFGLKSLEDLPKLDTLDVTLPEGKNGEQDNEHKESASTN